MECFTEKGCVGYQKTWYHTYSNPNTTARWQDTSAKRKQKNSFEGTSGGLTYEKASLLTSAPAPHVKRIRAGSTSHMGYCNNRNSPTRPGRISQWTLLPTFHPPTDTLRYGLSSIDSQRWRISSHSKMMRNQQKTYPAYFSGKFGNCMAYRKALYRIGTQGSHQVIGRNS